MLSQTVFELQPELLESRIQLEALLLDQNPSTLKGCSASGVLGEFIPEWQRLTSTWNIQHSVHHFPLDIHTLKVVERTRNASFFKELSEYQQVLTLLAALLHDIDKNTGPPRLKGKLPIDKLHPIKSAEMSRNILTRLGYPPKATQRIYTLIHHHQAFGRLFILFSDGAPRHSLEKIAVKIRTTTLLYCLLALSEGDIRSVKRKDALYTSNVALRLPEYAQAVHEEILDFRQHIPLMPQNLSLNWDTKRLVLDKSACFVLPGENWLDLSDRLKQLAWGGAAILPYYPALNRLQEQQVPCAALIRFLPENLAYWGPQPEKSICMPFGLNSMDIFYGILLGKPLKPDFLSTEEAAFTQNCRHFYQVLDPLLNTVGQEQGYNNWTEAMTAFEEGWFEPSEEPLPSDPLLLACQTAYQAQFENQPTIGVGTRPILMGFYQDGTQSPELPEAWQEVPVFRAAET